jgi:hypothetical protein
MKTIKIYFAMLTGMALGFTACNDSFLEQIPQTDITVPGFFKSVSDLQTYVNGLYNDGTLCAAGGWNDYESDNVAYSRDASMYSGILNDNLSPDNTGGWDGWSSLRSVNVMLANLDNVTGDQAEINNLVGIARYFRAWFYINKISVYSDVPWIDKPLDTDAPLLYEAASPRAEVVEHVMEDLDFAVNNIKGAASSLGNKTHVSKWAALALASRFALFEGTFRKYHSELGLEATANSFLEKSVEASEQIINSGLFDITDVAGTGKTTDDKSINFAEGFRALFTSVGITPSPNLKDNAEIILWTEYVRNKTGGNASSNLMSDYNANGFKSYSLSRSLMESFLDENGNPYDGSQKEWKDVFARRDPRFAETFAYPGVYETQNGINPIYHRAKPIRGGYHQVKFFLREYNEDFKMTSSLGQYNGIPLYRYGEILLNYAEAKAELGQWSQDIADKTINKLRDRVGMPHFDAGREVDQNLRAMYTEVSSNNVLLALRRERRVELAGEGLRLWDINRWHAGRVFGLDISKQGIYVPGLPYTYDPTDGNGQKMSIAQNEALKTNNDDEWHFLDGNTEFYLENATSGYIRNVGDDNRHFDDPKDYYRPIPTAQTVLNPNLKQPYGWEK